MIRHVIILCLAGSLFFLKGWTIAEDPKVPVSSSAGGFNADQTDEEFAEQLELQRDPRYQELQRIKEALKPLPIVNLESQLQSLETMPPETLEEFHAFAQRLHDRAKEKWAAVRRKLDNLKLSAMTPENFRAYNSLIDFFKLKEEYARRMRVIHDRENAAFRELFGEDLHSAFTPNPANVTAWNGSPGFEKAREEEAELHRWLGEEGKKIRREFQFGKEAVQQQVDKWWHEVRGEYESIAKGVRKIEAEIARRKGIQQQQREEEERLQALRFRHNEDRVIKIATGEVHDVWFWVSKGVAPYRLLMHVKANNTFVDRTIDGPDSFMIPFVFNHPGRHQVLLQMLDSELAVRKVQLNFEVSGKKIAPEPTKGPVLGGKTSAPGPEPRVKEPVKERPPLVGRFHAQLMPVMTIGTVSMPVVRFPISISRDGAISGQADAVERPGSKSILGASENFIHARTTFRMEGHTDQKTGKTKLRVLDGWFEARYQSADDIFENRMEFSQEFYGWRIPGSEDERLLKRYLQGLGGSRIANIPPLLRDALPKTRTSAQGKPEFNDTGFLGIRVASDDWDRTSFQVNILPVVVNGEALPGTENRFGSAADSDSKGQNTYFFLRLLEPVENLAPDPQLKGRELVGVGIFPLSPTTIVEGQGVDMEVGVVFLDNVFQIEYMTATAKWIPGPGLRQTNPRGRPAEFEATVAPGARLEKPRRSWVRVEIDTEDGDIMGDTVPVIILPAKVKAP